VKQYWWCIKISLLETDHLSCFHVPRSITCHSLCNQVGELWVRIACDDDYVGWDWFLHYFDDRSAATISRNEWRDSPGKTLLYKSNSELPNFRIHISKILYYSDTFQIYGDSYFYGDYCTVFHKADKGIIFHMLTYRSILRTDKLLVLLT